MDDTVRFIITPSAIGYAVGLILTLPVLFYMVKIPFKRRYHHIYTIFVAIAVPWFGMFFVAQSSDNPEIFFAISRLAYFVAVPVWLTLIYHSTAYFVNPKLNRLQKYVLLGAYTWLIVVWWIPLIIDPSFHLTRPRGTPLGWISGAGSLTPYYVPYGINLFNTTLSIFTFVMLFRYYRTQQSSLVKGQILYQSGTIFLIVVSGYAFRFAQYFGGLNILPYLASAGITVLLIGLRKHGFFSIKPVEEVQDTMPLPYIVEGRSTYFVANTGSMNSFKVFADLVRHSFFGLCITRRTPNEVRQIYDLKTTPVLRLTEEKDKEAVNPTDLQGLWATAKGFLLQAEHPVLMLDGLEYLVSINGFSSVLRLTARLGDFIERKQGIMLVSLVPDALTERERALLSAELPSLRQLEIPGAKPLAPTLALPTVEQNDGQYLLQFETEDGAKSFRFFAKAFLQDYVMNRIFIDAAGWLTALDLAEGLGMPRSKVYKQDGGPGPVLAELLKRGLVEARLFPGQRGRGGTIMKFRVNYSNPYVKRELDRLAMQP